MADLKKDLDEYLLLQSDQKKSFKLEMPKMPSISTPGLVSKLFGKNQESEANSWLKDPQETCCPKLVSTYSLELGLFLVIILFSISEPNTKDRRICDLPWPGSVLYDRIDILHSGVDPEGKEVCPIVHIGKHLLHYEVCFALSVLSRFFSHRYYQKKHLITSVLTKRFL